MLDALDDIEFNIGVNKDDIKRAKKIASDYYRCFGTEDGKRVLRHLVKTFIMESRADLNASPLSVGIRDGRADVVKQILQQINLAKEARNG